MLDIYTDDPNFFPREIVGDRSGDRPSGRVSDMDRAVEWRRRVKKCLRIKDELYAWEVPWRRRYMDMDEFLAFTRWRYRGAYSPLGARAVNKIYFLMEKARVFWV